MKQRVEHAVEVERLVAGAHGLVELRELGQHVALELRHRLNADALAVAEAGEGSPA